MACIVWVTSNAQTPPDTTLKKAVVKDTVYKHSPRKATLYSAILPGLGQIYNKKYWKLPIVYGAFAGAGFFIGFNQGFMNDYQRGLRQKFDDDPTTDDYPNLSVANLTELEGFYRRNRDISIVIGVLFYALNILDANVDAHLYDFDVSNDLSLNVKPTLLTTGVYRNTPGLSLSLHLK